MIRVLLAFLFALLPLAAAQAAKPEKYTFLEVDHPEIDTIEATTSLDRKGNGSTVCNYWLASDDTPYFEHLGAYTSLEYAGETEEAVLAYCLEHYDEAE